MLLLNLLFIILKIKVCISFMKCWILVLKMVSGVIIMVYYMMIVVKLNMGEIYFVFVVVIKNLNSVV